MRFAHIALLAVFAVAAPAACSDPVPPTPDGAWSIALTQTDPLMCTIGSHVSQAGDVSDTERKTVLTDGVKEATVSCSVIGAKTFAVKGHLVFQDKALDITIPKIDSGATKDSPAAGQASYASAK